MAHEATIRLAFFLGLFAVFAVLEAMAPGQTRSYGRGRRWPTNLAFAALDTLTLRALALFLPALAIGAALDAQAQGWGLFNWLAAPQWLEVGLAILLFDLAIWAQHLVTHNMPLFWRFHRVHHSDRDFDVATAVRFHPVEIAASMGLKVGLVYLLGPAPIAVLAFEILLNGTALFNHANLRLPPQLDRALRLLLVTPDMHRVHHSILREEHDSNFGFALSVWDRIFGTYRPIPKAGLDGMKVGLEWQDDAPTRLGWSLWLPFRK